MAPAPPSPPAEKPAKEAEWQAKTQVEPPSKAPYVGHWLGLLLQQAPGVDGHEVAGMAEQGIETAAHFPEFCLITEHEYQQQHRQAWDQQR
ncbi:MAG: hypothetical protein TQ37_09025 [Candidatus Synechococcus spongiarum 15L]|uniref:Uncharacterized protein n=2 Tax=Candidatus Synechococcus spongiarum TaxID=431041 RepID=A0A1T1D6A5_9SYNE|nr:MAG: hypothetical protein TQ37_09025 [Candidatus Synechococcus spongiarum 15L]OOV36330.1 hypothetical protein BV53_01055 [Candidatus Synechococcus spongiarum LMB bulk15N]